MLGFGLGLNKWRRVGGGFVGLLDLFPNAAAAYSLRKLRAAYSGAAVRVRRSSDNTEQDIAFDANGDLDTASLLSFVNEDVIQYTSDFSSTEDLSEFNGTGAAAQSVGGVDDAYKFTLSGGSATHFPEKVSLFQTNALSYDISFDYYIPSGNTSCDGIKLNFITGSPNLTTQNSWTSVQLTDVQSSTSGLRFYASDGGSISVNGDGDVFYLKNIVVTQTTADGFVTVWYDQSLSNDATQTTAANQPKIVSAGSLVTENGKAAIDFDGVDDYISISNIPNLSNLNNAYYFITHKPNNVNQDAGIFQHNVDVDNYIALGLGDLGTAAKIGSRLFKAGAVVDTHGYNALAQMQITSIIAEQNINSIKVLLNGVDGLESYATRSGGTILSTIGASNVSVGFYADIKISEFIYYFTDQSSNQSAIESNQATFYGITL